MTRKYALRLVGWLVALSLLVVFALTLQANRYAIMDWWILRSYEPSSQIVEIANDLSLTEKGKNILYVHDPQIAEAALFNDACGDSDKDKSIILGCYADGKINIFNVEDQRLEGVVEVTAAHEILHAAYDRLEGKYKNDVDSMLLQAQANIIDARLTKALSGYVGLPQDQFINELHSILGTVVEELPSQLEEYYSQFFSDRQIIVKADKAYEQVFSELRAKIDADDAELARLNQQIVDLEASLSIASAQIAQQRNELNALIQQDRIEEYNQQRLVFNDRVVKYNVDIVRLNNLIDRYNKIVKDRKSLGLEESSLYESINSRKQSESTQL